MKVKFALVLRVRLMLLVARRPRLSWAMAVKVLVPLVIVNSEAAVVTGAAVGVGVAMTAGADVLAGAPAVTFVVALIGALLAFAWTVRRRPRATVAALVGVAVLLLGVPLLLIARKKRAA